MQVNQNTLYQDAHKWLRQISLAYGDPFHAVNLCIGGCSLQTHWDNFVSNAPAYDMEINGQCVGKISIPDALTSDEWDIITFQQASHFSGEISTYYPYLPELYEGAKKLSNGTTYIHQTWAYEKDTTHDGFAKYGNDQKQMYKALTAAYRSAAETLHCPIIPVGEVVQYIRENCPAFDYSAGGLSLNRDGYHLSLLYGRYAAALTWYAVLTGYDITDVRFIPEHDSQKADIMLLKVIHDAVRAVLIKDVTNAFKESC